MTEHTSDLREDREAPTLREILEGYTAFNEWEEQEQARLLPQLTVQEGLRQYFELRRLADVLAAGSDQVFLEQNAKHWTKLHERNEKIAAATQVG